MARSRRKSRFSVDRAPAPKVLPISAPLSEGERRFRLILLVVAALVAIAGWRLLLFLTDDAFIAFRYVSNRMLGHGLVWNPAPFLPVEGYTSFLWVALLEIVWRVTGIEPPQAANGLSLAFGLGTLLLAGRMLVRGSLPAGLAPVRRPLVAVALLGIVTHRTWLTWLSSGLETALFNFCLTAWVYFAVAPAETRGRPARIVGLCGAAAAAALARPDGLLFVATTGLLLADLATGLSGGPRFRFSGRRAAAAAPLVLVPLHLLFRHARYGEWLPNTYFAKYTSPWPESGVRYLASFVVEYGLWVWLALAAVWAARSLFRPGDGAPTLGERMRVGTVPLLTGAAVVAHVAWYTLLVGGDHFEFRVYSHLPPLLLVSAVWLAGRVFRTGRAALAAIVLLVVASWPIPWTHWNATRALTTREQTQVMIVPVADRFPPVVRIPVEWWDGWQAWLIEHHVCMRRRGHQVFCEEQLRFWPSRAEGLTIGWEQRAVLAAPTVGVPAWVLPEVAIIDLFGLNDRVIARSPVSAGEERLMAHERTPPPGYVRHFRPNVFVVDGEVRIAPRPEPLTDTQIRAGDTADWLGQ